MHMQTIDLLIGDHDAQEAGGIIINTNPVNTTGFTPRDVLDLILQNDNSTGSLNHMIKMIETFQKAGALKSNQIAINKKTQTVNNINNNNNNNNNNSNSNNKCTSFRFIITLWRELTKEIEESSIETQNALMVVAVLIATMTYQAILSPPSGFSNNTPVDYYSKNDAVLINTKSALNVGEGEAVMASDPHVFVIFTVFNAIGFFASLGMISVLTSGFPLRAGLRLAILSMVATYVIAVFYEAPTKMRTVFVVLWLMGLVVLFELGRFGFWLLRKCGILKFSRRSSPPSLDGYPHDQQNNHHQLDF
ncbi:uncharacterized protein LOC115709977 [Cannabis sativa]|uniref:uncharacterized protein LOC115709977 n=1 Tax=Cannabis sativa TaxID=3483 RepID=UPI0029CA041A|nr:uncharacterized protein LOC115709977 [Cannabis sativa]